MRICTRCGKAFSSEALYCPYCGSPPYRLGRLCPRGHPNPPSAHFCATCGSSDLSEASPRPSLRRRLLSFSIRTVVILALSCLVWSLGRGLWGQGGVVFEYLVFFCVQVATLVLLCFIACFVLSHEVASDLKWSLFDMVIGAVRISFRLLWHGVLLAWRGLILFLNLPVGRRRR